MRVRPSVYIVENGKVLTMKYTYGGEEVYNLPGGNLEFGEGLKEALERELIEELKVKVSVGDMMCMGEVHLHGKVKLHIVFEGNIVEGTPSLNPDETTALSVEWLPLNKVITNNLYPNITSYLASNPKSNTYLGVLPQQWF